RASTHTPGRGLLVSGGHCIRLHHCPELCARRLGGLAAGGAVGVGEHIRRHVRDTARRATLRTEGTDATVVRGHHVRGRRVHALPQCVLPHALAIPDRLVIDRTFPLRETGAAFRY